MPEKEIWTCQNNWCTFSIGTLNTWYPMGYIDVGDGCWRPNVLMTRFGCWQQVTPPISNISHRHRILAYYDDGDRCKSLRIWLKLDKIVLNLASNWISCLQNNISVTNITFWHIMMLLTDWNVTNMQEYVTNIDVTHDIQCLRVDFFFNAFNQCFSETTDKTSSQAKTVLKRHHKHCLKNYKKGKIQIFTPHRGAQSRRQWKYSLITVQENESYIARVMEEDMVITIFRLLKTVLFFNNQLKMMSK